MEEESIYMREKWDERREMGQKERVYMRERDGTKGQCIQERERERDGMKGEGEKEIR